MLEFVLWIIFYTAFILPVAKCISHSTGGELELEDCLGYGLIWPVAIVGILGGEFICYVLKLISKKVIYLIED